jgi:Rod binding domain-containing protein
LIDAISVAHTEGLSTTPRPKDDPARVKGAAQQFEALLLGQMMKSMHDADGGWLGTGDDQSASSAMEYGQEIFAQALASSGGLGLASLVANGLQKPVEP